MVAVRVSKGNRSEVFLVTAKDGTEEGDLGSSVVGLVLGHGFKVEVKPHDGKPDSQSLSPDEFYEQAVMGDWT